MYFNEVEVVELGLAEELIQDTEHQLDSEGTVEPTRIKLPSAAYVADAE